MNEGLNGLLSGKYDSTKQRAVLLNGDRQRNYQSYTLTMRMELLLTGHLVLTDAQFFDGLYFHWLAKNADEFRAFKKFLVSFDESFCGICPPFSISVKCRPQSEDTKQALTPDIDEVAVKMYCKQFQFSSIEEDNLANAVFDMSSDYEERIHIWGKDDLCPIRPCEHSLDEYIKETQIYLDTRYGDKSSIAVGWGKYSKRLRTLFDMKPNKWGYLASKGKWCMPFYLQQCLDQPFPKNTAYTYRRQMRKYLEQAEREMANAGATRIFARILDELNCNIENRSKIVIALEALERLNQDGESVFRADRKRSDGREKDIEAYFRDIRQLMNDRYNKALAYQHGCRFLDMCDYTGMDTVNISRVSLSIPEELISPLAELSWADFKKWLDENKADLEEPFNRWMTAYVEYTANDSSAAEESMKQYLTVLKKAILKAPSSAQTEVSKPWDEFGIIDETIHSTLADTYNHPYYFVGGGSFEASAPGNEICILCMDEDAVDGKGLMIFRLRLDKDSSEDLALDTLLAPVCNPLNGGALPAVV